MRIAKALEGVRVLECSVMVNGPFAGTLLAELGAEVIKIEPPWGELARQLDKAPNGESWYFMVHNIGKKFITLNLKHEKGKGILKDLIRKSDVFLENYSPGTMDRFGLGYDEMKKVNPAIIYASSTGYGYSGQYSSYPAFDWLIQAISGIMSITGYPNRPPVKSGAALLDFGSAFLMVVAILAALRYKEKTGKGQRIDMALYDVAITYLTEYITSYLNTGEVSSRIGNLDRQAHPVNVYKTVDGFVFIAAVSDAHWEALCKALQLGKASNDPRFKTIEGRIIQRNRIDRLINKQIGKKTSQQVLEELREFEVPCAPVRTIEEVAKDPHSYQREMIKEVRHPALGAVKFIGSPLKLSESKPIADSPGLPIGYHNDEVLGSLLGYSKTKVRALRKDGAI